MSGKRDWLVGPGEYPQLRAAHRCMHYDSCGQEPSDEQSTAALRWTAEHLGVWRLAEAEDWLLYVPGEDWDLDDPWFVALCGEYNEALALTPPRVSEVLNSVFEQGDDE